MPRKKKTEEEDNGFKEFFDKLNKNSEKEEYWINVDVWTSAHAIIREQQKEGITALEFLNNLLLRVCVPIQAMGIQKPVDELADRIKGWRYGKQ